MKSLIKATSTILITSIVMIISQISPAETINKKNIFDITSKIYINRKLVSSPRIITKENESASIQQTSKNNRTQFLIKITPSNMKFTSNAIKLTYDINYKNNQNNLHSTPILILEPNQQGKIKFSTRNRHSFEMLVSVKHV